MDRIQHQTYRLKNIRNISIGMSYIKAHSYVYLYHIINVENKKLTKCYDIDLHTDGTSKFIFKDI